MAASLSAPAARGGYVPKRKRPSIWLVLPVLLLVVLSLLPLAYVGVKAWQAGWAEALHLLWRPYVFGLLRNTLALMVGVTITCGVIGLSLAWLLERSNLPGRRLWGVILCLPFAVPAFVSSFTWVSLSAQFEGLGGAILVMSLSKYPLIFLPVAATLRNLDPSLEESARTLGQNRWGVFFRVTLPLLWPSLLAGSLLIALHMLVEFGALSIIGLQTFTTAIYQQFELEFSNANAAMLSAVLLALCLALLWLELRVRGKGRHVRTGQGAARQAEQVRLGPWAAVGQAYCLMLAIVGSGIPLGMLAYWLAVGSSAAFPVAAITEALLSSLGTFSWRCGAVPGAGRAGRLAGGALQRPTGDLGRALAVSATCPARFGDCADAGVFRPALRAGAVPDVGIAADRLCVVVFATGAGADSYGAEQGCAATGRGRAHAGGFVVHGVLPGDVADYLPGTGRGVCAGVSGCDEGVDGDVAIEPDRA
jgi:ABC-type Fe3+ transport system permease subunit